ncbi:MAG TPA: hypothetical protein VM580_12640 [Labilithrix sp.]|nr:hypothetical protein [Labilithrix sp.]
MTLRERRRAVRGASATSGGGRLVLLLVAVCAALVACQGIRADEGHDALMQVEGGQFFRAPMPDGQAGPRVLTSTVRERSRAGTVQQSAVGDLERSAMAIAVGIAGDVGYWVVPAKLPHAAAPDLPTFELQFALSRVAPGPREIIFRAVDAERRFGPPLVRPLNVVAEAPSGHLVVSLGWNNGADLDLHVVLPSGIEIFKRNPTEYERPPASAGPVPSGTPIDGGVLDRDSNAQCVADGRRAENVIWTEAPPKGRYIVRVDTYSLCGEPSAYWRVAVRLDGAIIKEAAGTSTGYDVRFPHNRGGGVLALEFDVP